ncbi:HXXEE domain-containing protein [Oscillospiraceae bacterium PP1C4]
MNELMWFSWLFPLLFIIHDIEEIITVKKWCAKGYQKHIPFPVTPFGNTKSTQSFAVGVYEELILWCIATLIGNLSGSYGFWYGLLIMNILHLILFHIILLPLSYRRYVPGEITAWITLFPCCYILYLAQGVLQYSPMEGFLWISIAIIFAVANIKFLHKNIDNLANFIKF